MSFKFLLVVLLSMRSVSAVLNHPDEKYTLVELIRSKGYPVEVHKVTTRDGYILKLIRIPHGRNTTHSNHAILLVHGLGGQSSNYVTRGPPDALAYYLSDSGYDTWLFNARGTVHSRRHVTLDPLLNRKTFWNFSWHEIAVYDLPASIDYVLNKTRKPNLFYIGHSQGFTTSMVLLSEKPEYNSRIRLVVGLAPSVFLNFTDKPLLMALARHWSTIERITSALGLYEFIIPNSPMFNNIISYICKLSDDIQQACLEVGYALGGLHSKLTKLELLPLILRHTPSGLSPKQLFHYGQGAISGHFRQYDHEKAGNIKKYGREEPPDYNLSNVVAPIAPIYAARELFANEKAVKRLSRELPNLAEVHKVNHSQFNHIDFLYAYNLEELVGKLLLEILRKYED